jgi:hypothetical protein
MATKSTTEGNLPFITKRDGMFGSGLVFLVTGAYSLFAGQFYLSQISMANSFEIWIIATALSFILAAYCLREYRRLTKKN